MTAPIGPDAPEAAPAHNSPVGPDSASVPAADRAARTWHDLREFVHIRNDRRKVVSEALDMSFTRAKALRRLVAGPLTMRELAERLMTDKPYTTLVVDELERRGYIERAVHPTDRRQRVVTATPAGLSAARRANAILSAPPAALLALPPEDL
ncbi:MarR family transcriptional regulator, partial [Streptomyces sp. SID3343]|uniref:MarR family winged helix-turn-helix transcriptional regulator n=1 Tax=Streptomyces sp. SID3343 TaxID=2690260 RepID=UPI001367F7E5